MGFFDEVLDDILGKPKKQSEDIPSKSNLPSKVIPQSKREGPTSVPEKKIQVPDKGVPPQKKEEPKEEYDPAQKVRELRRLLRKYQKEAKRVKLTSKPPSPTK